MVIKVETIVSASKIRLIGKLELRCEIRKYVSNLLMHLLKCLYDGHSIIESYKKGDVELHEHWGCKSRVRSSYDDEQTLNPNGCEDICGVITARALDPMVMLMDDEMPMLVWVGDGSESPRPINSVVRLQPLNACRMRVADASEVGLAPSLESRWLALNRELSSVLRRAGVEDSQLENEVVQSAPEIVDDLTHQDRDLDGDRALRSSNRDWNERVRGMKRLLGKIHLRCVLGDLILSVDEVPDDLFQLRKVFHCPVKPSISSIEGMIHDLKTPHKNSQEQ